jgi:4-hydroxybenzoate polyprenyltransferase
VLKGLQKGLHFLLHSQIWIATGAVWTTWATYLQTERKPQILLLLLLFFATLLTYNLFIFWYEKKLNFPFFVLQKGERVGKISLLSSTCALFGLVFFLSANQFLFLIHLGFLSIFYTLPLPLSPRLSIPPLRKIPYLKIFIVAYVWASSTVIFPTLEESLWIDDPDTLQLFFQRLIWIFALTLPFDLRDADADSKQALPTLARHLGKRRVSFLIFFLFSILIVWEILFPIQIKFGALQSISFTFMLVFSIFAQHQNSQKIKDYHILFLDGMISGYGILISSSMF